MYGSGLTQEERAKAGMQDPEVQVCPVDGIISCYMYLNGNELDRTINIFPHLSWTSLHNFCTVYLLTPLS